MIFEPRTTAQNKRIHHLITETGFDEDHKAQLAKAYSRGRTTKTSELSKAEAHELIKHLEGIQKNSFDKMRTKIVGIARQIGFVQERDFHRLNEWVKKHWGKSNIFQLSHDELVRCVSGMQALEKQAKGKEVTNG